LLEIKLQHLYRSLDLLSESKGILEEKIFFKNRNLFNIQIDVVFYDVTTFSFESVRKDSPRDFGFSKDAKFKEVQVVMGLLIDRKGRPIRYDYIFASRIKNMKKDIKEEIFNKAD